MSIKNKIAFILAFVFVLYGSIEYSIQRYIVLPSFISLEHEEAIKNSKRSVEAIQREIHHLDTFCHDWAGWDDTYEFIVTRSKEYIEANLVLSTFTDNNIDTIYFSDVEGKIVWGEIYDLETEESMHLPEFPTEKFSPNHPAVTFNFEGKPLSEVSISGIYMTQRGPMLFASRPILTSDNEGPSRGAMMMGRFLNQEIVKTLVDQTQVNFEVLLIQPETLSESVKDILHELKNESDHMLKNTNKEFVDAYTTFSDINGDAALLIHAKTPRKISEKGYATMHFALYSLLGAGLCVFIVMLLLFQRTVLNPINNLTEHTLLVGKTGDLSTRISHQRKDEIGILANEFDKMLEQLFKARSKLLKQSYYSGLAEMASGILHNARNILTPVVGQIYKIREQIKNIPLNNIKKSVVELERDDLDPDREKPLKRYIELGSRQMVEVLEETDHQLEKVTHHIAQIEDLLTEQDKLSHAERVLEPIHVKRVLKKALTMIPEEYKDSVSIESDPSISNLPTVLTEQFILTQVFTNLLNNAAESILRAGKRSGNILLKGTVHSDGNNDMVHIEVRDDGEGIEKKMLTSIFDRAFSNKKSKSSGMGLHWSSNAILAMNGKLYAESDGIGKGACFHVILPAYRQ